VKLTPRQPPGRLTRKARHFEAEIAVLRAQGYTLQAIRHALEDAGVQVSISTVRREAVRSTAAAGRLAASGGDAPVPAPDSSPALPLPAPSSAAAHPQPVNESRTAPGTSSRTKPLGGKDVAAAYASTWIDNSLVRASLRTKEHP
jgi:hypothetical protein